MKTLSKIFFTGLATILPIGVTVYVLWWLGTTTEDLLQPVIVWAYKPAEHWPPFIGIIVAVLIVFAVGVLMNLYVVRTLWKTGENLLNRIPLVKTLYGSVRDLMGFFATAQDEDKEASQVVAVTLPGTDARMIGLLTRENFGDLPAGIGGSDTVAVYLPMSYQIGGFTVMVPRSAVETIDMTTEEAMRFAVTAGMANPE